MEKSEQSRVANAALNAQRGLMAIIGTCLGSALAALAWKLFTQEMPRINLVMMLLSGVIVGLAVRLFGRGVTFAFRIAAVIGFLFAIAIATGLGARYGSAVLFIVEYACILVGAITAGSLATRSLSDTERSALWSPTVELHQKHLMNRWWCMVPTLTVALMFTGVATMYIADSLALFKIKDTVAENRKKEQAQARILEDPNFEEEARDFGRLMGYFHTNPDHCYRKADERLGTCMDEVCIKRNPYFLEGCLETLGQFPDE